MYTTDRIESSENLSILLVGNDSQYCLKLKTQLRGLLKACTVSDCSIHTAKSLRTRNFDLVLIDVGLLSNGNDVIAVLQNLQKGKEKIKSLLLYNNLNFHLINPIKQVGARSHAFKLELNHKLEDIISTVLQGKAYNIFSEEHTSLQNITPDPSTSNIPDQTLTLTERQFQVLKLVEEGLINREIGRELYITEHTVKVYVRELFEIFGVPRRKKDPEASKFNSRNLLVRKARNANIVIQGENPAIIHRL